MSIQNSFYCNEFCGKMVQRGVVMIIDIHTHCGIVDGKFNMPVKMQLDAMKKYGIDYALISDIECGYGKELAGNRYLLDTVKKYPEKFGGMLWCSGDGNCDIRQFEKLYLENREFVKGLKIHPDISGIRFDDRRFTPYIGLAERYSLPILIHTQETDFSKISYVEDIADKFKDVKFILGHMSLCSDGSEALAAVKKHANIYADTAWVKYGVVKQAFENGISEKIMFGTDSPIGGLDTYGDKDFYTAYYDSDDKFTDGVMYENAVRIFNLKK